MNTKTGEQIMNVPLFFLAVGIGVCYTVHYEQKKESYQKTKNKKEGRLL